jgi:hypothetical protein
MVMTRITKQRNDIGLIMVLISEIIREKDGLYSREIRTPKSKTSKVKDPVVKALIKDISVRKSYSRS